MPSVGDLYVSLGFNVDSKALDQFDKGIKNLSSNMLELLGVTGVSAYGLNKFVTDAMGGAQTMTNLAQGTRLAADELQNYSNVVAYFNKDITALGAAKVVSDLEKRLLDWQLNGKDPGLNMLLGKTGVSPAGKNAIEYLNSLGEHFQLDQSPHGLETEGSLLRSAGLPTELMNTLNAAPEQLAAAHKQVDITIKQQETLAESSRRLNQAFLSLGTIIERLVADKLVPLLEALGIKTDDLKDIKKNLDENSPYLTKRGAPTSHRDIPTSWLGKLNLGLTSGNFWSSNKTPNNDPKNIPESLFVQPGTGNNLGSLPSLPPLPDNIFEFLSKHPKLQGPGTLPAPFGGGPNGSDAKVSNNVTIYNQGEVHPNTWLGYTQRAYQAATNQLNNANVA